MDNIGIATIGLALLTNAPGFGASSNDATDQPQVQIAKRK